MNGYLKRFRSYLTVLLIAAALPVFCAGTAGAAAMSVRDALGRDIHISLPVERIVTLNSDVLEVLRTLKADNLVVGVFSEIVREPGFWGDLARKPKVGSWCDPDMEAIAALKPDVVIAYSRSPSPELDQKMALFGISVLRLDFYKVDSLEREVRVLGQILNRTAEADLFCEWHRRHLEMIREKIAGVSSRPTVYVESYTDYHAAGPGSGGHEMCTLAGGNNISADFSIPFPQVTPEWVVSQNPEVIVKAASWGNGYNLKDSSLFNKKRDIILKRPAWEHIRAVASGNVHVLDSSIWTGPRAIIGIAYMARWIHPDLFPDLDPEALHKEYLETFQRMPYRGVFTSDDVTEAGR